MNMDLHQLTRGEQYWLWRHRLEWTQPAAAAYLGCSYSAYNRAEHEKGNRLFQDSLPLFRLGKRVHFDLKILDLIVPSTIENIRLCRRRSGLSMTEIANRCKISRVTLLAAERRCDPKIIAFWQEFGFTNVVGVGRVVSASKELA